MSRHQGVVHVERPGHRPAQVELTSTCVYFSTAVGDELTPGEFWVLAHLRRAGRRSWGLAGRSPWEGCGHLSDYDGRLYAPPEDTPAIHAADHRRRRGRSARRQRPRPR